MLRSFIGPFLFVFSVLFFIFVVQFAWQKLEIFIGKGLTISQILTILVLLGVTVVQMVFPLSILLSTIMLYGGMGERYELVAMKASGMSLVRIFKPLLILSMVFAVCLYFFSDQVVPLSQRKSKNMIFNIIRNKPTLNFTQGVFLDGIPGFSMRIGEKSGEDGRDLKDVFIHKKAFPSQDQLTIKAKKGLLVPSINKNYLRLDLYDGYYYQEDVQGIPYRERERQRNKTIKFDTLVQYFDVSSLINSAIENESVSSYYLFMDNEELSRHIDSTRVKQRYAFENISKKNYRYAVNSYINKKDSIKEDLSAIDFTDPNLPKRERIFGTVLRELDFVKKQINLTKEEIVSQVKSLAKQQLQFHKTYAYAFTCIVFFLIGASLGAIIRKGGMGMPILIATVIFVLFYLISYSSESMAKKGSMNPILAAWLANLIMFPLALFFTYKAKTESALFNMDSYMTPIKNFFSKFVKSKEEHRRYQ